MQIDTMSIRILQIAYPTSLVSVNYFHLIQNQYMLIGLLKDA